MDTRTIVFRTKVDLWLVGVLVVSMGAGLWAAIRSVRTNPSEGWFPLSIIAGSLLLVVVLAVPTEYIVTDSDLIIRSGMMRKRIAFESIQRVYRTRSPLSAPAWSLDRLGIDYRSEGQRGLALISPSHQKAFLELLQDRVGLKVSGSELVRSSGAHA